MRSQFKVKPIYVWVGLALATQSHFLLAAGPYPALPPTLSTSVTPNVMLLIDNSGSMLQNENNQWIKQSTNSSCDTDSEIWTGCITGNTTYRNWIDSEISNPNTKMNIAKRVSRSLVTKNPTLRWGVSSFRVDNTAGIGGAERGEGGKIVTPIGNSIGTTADSSTSTVMGGINSLRGRTSTPLGEALIEITRYYEGKASAYSVIAGNYTSPIQYRCQKNFTIVLTDGDANDDGNHPGVSICSSETASCPLILEGTNSTTPGYGTSSNRLRALRDVAKYANELDMRTTGNDLDGKSYQDEKFKIQDMQTYTVGFAVTNNVLPAAAKVGGGKYYNANNEAELTSSLNNAVNDIVASISNAGGVATQSEILTAGNKVFQPVFNPNGWYGELRCYNLDGEGNFNPITSKCTPNEKAIFPVVSSRKIYSSKVVGTTTSSFIFNSSNLSSMTTEQSNYLGSDNAERANVINFIRGTENISGAGFRTRPNGLLGDIIDSQPVVISKPSGETLDLDYSTFKASNKDRNIVMIGSNDGMLHAFSIGNMTELMGYIPSPVYSNLKSLTSSDYGINGGTPHEFHVNGSMRQADVKLSGTWKTILVGGLGQGGKGYFAIDTTTESNFNAPNTSIKWEWTDKNTNTMGYSFGVPLIYNVRTGIDTVTPAVILTNGYENKWIKNANPQASNTSSLYIVNADTGALIKQIDIAGSTGLSSAAGVDAGQDGVLDYVYAGDMNGKLWRFDLTSETPSNFKLISTPIYNAGSTKPITMRPAVIGLNTKEGNSIGNLIMFGTGKLLTDTDRSNTDVQSFYAVVDTMEDSPNTISESSLQQQIVTDEKTIVGDANVRAGTYRKISGSTLDLRSSSNTIKGWYLNLPTPSERLVTSPLIFDDKLVFGTGIPKSDEKCLPGGKGWVMGLNPFTGSVTMNNSKNKPEAYSFIDIDKSTSSKGKSTKEDKISFSSGEQFISGFQKDGIPTELTFVASTNKIVTPADTSGSNLDIGKVIAQRESNYSAVYTGNSKTIVENGKTKPTIKIYKPIPKPASTGTGSIYGGTVGSASLDKENLLSKFSGVKIETTIWREIK